MERLIFAFCNVIDWIEGIPYGISYYSWLVYHYTVGRLILLVKIWHINHQQKKLRKANPYYDDKPTPDTSADQPVTRYALSE